MNAVELIQRLHRHRAWVNGNLLTAVAGLSDGRLRSPFAIGQGSVWKPLVHLYAAEYVWLEALLGNEEFTVPGDSPGKLPGNQQGEGGVTDLAHRKSASLGTRLGVRRSDVLLHVCAHAHYTAAQVVNMLRQAGADRLPEAMLISLARQEATCR